MNFKPCLVAVLAACVTSASAKKPPQPYLSYTEANTEQCRVDATVTDGGTSFKYSGKDTEVCRVTVRLMQQGFTIVRAPAADAGMPDAGVKR
jgi:hypothetical protein